MPDPVALPVLWPRARTFPRARRGHRGVCVAPTVQQLRRSSYQDVSRPRKYLLGPGPAPDEVEDEDDYCNNQKQVNKGAADVGEQAEKPENTDNDGYPKQHGSFLC
jgi:hypothetical protein